MRDLGDRQAADHPQGERDPRLHRQGGVRAGEEHPEPVVVDGAERLGRCGGRSSGPAGACRRACPRGVARSRALLPAVVVSQPPGLGGTPSAGQRSTAVAKASAAASSAMSRSPNRRARVATTRAHSSRWTRAMTSSTSLHPVGLRRCRRRAGPRSCGGRPWTRRADSSSAASRSSASITQKPARYSFDSTKGPSVNTGLAAAAVGHGRVLGGGEAAAEHPAAVGLELVVERVDRLRARSRRPRWWCLR